MGLVLKMDARWLYRLSPILILVGLSGLVLVRQENQVFTCYVIAGLGCSYFFPFSTSIATRYFYESRHRLASLSVAALMLGSILGSITVGFLNRVARVTLAHAFQASLLCAIALIVFTWRLTREKPAPSAPSQTS